MSKANLGALYVERAALPAGVRPWGKIVAQPHPAGGAGLSPTGLSLTWEGDAGEASAAELVRRNNAYGDLLDACVRALSVLDQESFEGEDLGEISHYMRAAISKARGGA